MSHPDLIDMVIDKSDPRFKDVPSSHDGDIYKGGDALTGWQTEPNRTPQEKAKLDAEIAQAAEDESDRQGIIGDNAIRALITARPVQINNYIDNNVNNLEQAKTVLKILAKAVSMVVKKQFR